MPDSDPLDWLLRSPESFKVRFLQGLFERSAQLDETRGVVTIVQPPQVSTLVFEILASVGAAPVWTRQDPPTIAVPLDKAETIPLFSPVAMSDTFRRVLAFKKGKTADKSSCNP